MRKEALIRLLQHKVPRTAAQITGAVILSTQLQALPAHADTIPPPIVPIIPGPSLQNPNIHPEVAKLLPIEDIRIPTPHLTPLDNSPPRIEEVKPPQEIEILPHTTASPNEFIELIPQLTPLEQHIQKNQEEKNHVIEKVLLFENPTIDPKTRIAKIPGNMLYGIKNYSKQQELEDISMYFEIYKAAEEQFGIPWQLLWIIHAQESTNSRELSPESNGYRGAMQIAHFHMNNPEIFYAPAGYEFLNELPQKYAKKNGSYTNDWEEVMRAAAFIHINARDRYPRLSREEAVLQVIANNYSAPIYGQQRIQKFRELKAFFG